MYIVAASLGTARDNANFRSNLKRDIDAATTQTKAIMSDMKRHAQVMSNASRGEQQVFQEQRNRFSDEVNRLTGLTKKIASKERQTRAIDEPGLYSLYIYIYIYVLYHHHHRKNNLNIMFNVCF